VYDPKLVHVTTANRRKGKFHLQFWNLLGDPGSEGVAVRTWKDLIDHFPGVSMGSLVNGINQFIG
jgi:hypothetical protein